MTTFDPKKVSIKIKVMVFIAIVILTGIPMWVTNYAQYSNSFFIQASGVVITAICAGVLAYYTSYRKTTIILGTTAAHMVAFFIKVYIDCIEDPTNHNLVPFELVFFIFLDGAGGSVLTMVSRAMRDEQRSRELSDKNKK